MRINSLDLVRAIARLEFAPMTENDFASFAGAEPDAQICFTSDPAIIAAVEASDPDPSMKLDPEMGGVAVIADCNGIEASGLTAEGYALGFRLEAGAVG